MHSNRLKRISRWVLSATWPRITSKLASRPRYDYPWLVLCCTAAIALYSMATRYGNRLTSDGEWYLNIAENIFTGKGIVNVIGGEVIHWVPLYPITLSLSYHFQNPELFVWYYHAGLIILSILYWYRIASFLLLNRQAERFFLVLVVFNAPILFCYVYVLSEALFIALLSSFLYYFLRWHDEKRTIYFWISTITGFACMITRNASIFLLAPLFMYYFIQTWKSSNRSEKIFYIFHITLIMSGFLIWNLTKIFLNGNSQVVADLIPFFDLGRNTHLLVRSLAANFIPLPMAFVLQSLMVIFFFGIALYSFLKFSPSIHLLALSIIIVFYLGLWTIVPFDQWNIDRFIAPVMPLVLLILVWSLGQILPFKYLVILSTLLCVYPVIRALKNVLFWGEFI